MAGVSGSGTATAAYWFQFFLDSGIPPADAGNYAVTFTENRIQQDMIVDLTKDYLSEMGITVLGDMIAILKHAKRVHTQATREKVLKGSGLSSADMAKNNRTSNNSLLSSSNAVTKPIFGARISVPVRPSRATVEQKDEQLSEIPQPVPTQPIVWEQPELSSKSMAIQKVNSTSSPKVCKMPLRKTVQKKVQEPKIVSVPSAEILASLKPSMTSETQVPKVRNVTQEQEFNIILPSGNRKEINTNLGGQEKSTKSSALKSVFDRLGEERVESKMVESDINQAEETVKGSTVFCRLGEKKELKRPGSEVLTKIEPAKKVKISVENRLGQQNVCQNTLASAGIFGNSVKPDSRPVHLRLGGKSTPSATDSKSEGIKIKPFESSSGSSTSMSGSLKALESGHSGDTNRTIGVGHQNRFKGDLVIHVESQNPRNTSVRQTGPQKGGVREVQSVSFGSSSIMRRLGPQKPDSQSDLNKSGNIMCRLGPQRPGSNTKPQSQQDMSVTVHVGPTNTDELRTLKQTLPVKKTGVFSRLGSRTSSALL